MKLSQSVKKFCLDFPKQTWSVLMGNFDGVHRGHRDLIQKSLEKSKQNNHKLIVISFNPHPVCILNPHYKPFLLNTYEEKKELLKSVGVEFFVELSFDRDISSLSPEEFLQKKILPHSNIKEMYFGYDFTFGANRQGNYELVHRLYKDQLKLSQFEAFKLDDIAISSSLIRRSLRQGDTQKANEYLGRDFFIKGLVIKGAGRGRKIGFPTANLSFEKNLLIPARGVYSSVSFIRGMKYKSITNIGINPTFINESEVNVETHIFDFDDDLYGEQMTVYFKDFIREEKKFDSVNDLISQIKKDCQKAYGREDGEN